MPRYMIVRSFEVGEDKMPAVGRRSRELTEDDFPEITWEHSHVVVDDEALVRTFCVYEAPDEEIVREHASSSASTRSTRSTRSRRRHAGGLPASSVSPLPSPSSWASSMWRYVCWATASRLRRKRTRSMSSAAAMSSASL